MPKPHETRAFTHPIEVRTAEDGSINIRGYAAVFDAPAYSEVVKSSAFNRTLAQRDDVRLLVNHDGIPLARTKSGTLQLSADHRGLVVEANGLDPANPTVQELTSAMKRGDIDSMSFAFEALDEVTVDGIRELREVKLYDVSVVTYPWYDSTSVEMNSLDRALVKLRSRSPLEDEEREAVVLALDIQPEVVADDTEPVIEETKSLTLAEARALLGLDPAA